MLETYVPRTINRVLICLTEPAAASPAGLQSAAAGLQKRLSLTFNLARLAASYRDVSKKRPSKNVLRDDFAPVNLMRLRKADGKDWQY